MNRTPQWLIWSAVIVTGFIVLYLLRGVLLPFVAGMAIAFLFDPVADRLQTLGLSRVLATTMITVSFFLLLILGLILLLPLITNEVQQLAAALPGYIARARELIDSPALERLRQLFAPPVSPGQAQPFSGMMSNVASWLGGFLGQALSGGIALFSMLSLIFLTPFVAFYLLLDWDRMVAHIDGLLPRDHAPVIRRLALEVNSVLAGFIRGQIVVCLLLAAFYATALSLAGLKFGFVVGIIAGLLSFVPFLGALIGLVLSLGLAIVQFWPALTPIGVVLAIFVAGQTVEGNFLTPRLVGKRVSLHPLWVIFALLAFGTLLGFTGMLLAVPLAATIGVLARHGTFVYLQSRLFNGSCAGDGDGPATGP